jgi:hypothetical protein
MDRRRRWFKRNGKESTERATLLYNTLMSSLYSNHPLQRKIAVK